MTLAFASIATLAGFVILILSLRYRESEEEKARLRLQLSILVEGCQGEHEWMRTWSERRFKVTSDQWAAEVECAIGLNWNCEHALRRAEALGPLPAPLQRLPRQLTEEERIKENFIADMVREREGINDLG